MRVAALYDIHGNLPALEAVLEEIGREGVERVVVGGDVLPGPLPDASLRVLLELGASTSFIRGNGENDALDARAGGGLVRVPEPFRESVRWSAAALAPERAEAIGAWEATLEMEIEGLGTVHFCHATPRSDVEIITRETPPERVEILLASASADLVVCGHTHMQFDRRVGPKRVVNAGSVGMPFADPGAYWLLLGPGVELRRTEYDLEAAADRIRRSGSPGAEAFARDHVLRPPPEAEMLARFEAASSRASSAG